MYTLQIASAAQSMTMVQSESWPAPEPGGSPSTESAEHLLWCLPGISNPKNTFYEGLPLLHVMLLFLLLY